MLVPYCRIPGTIVIYQRCHYWPHGDWFDQLKSWTEMLYVDARDAQIYESSQTL